MRIAFFDSGIGGLTVLNEARRFLPMDEYIYYADSQNVPYGTKTKEEVISHVLKAADFLARMNIDALVVACNTASAVAIEDLRARFPFPVIGMEPAIKPAIYQNTGKKILVLATTLTLHEKKLNALLAELDKTEKTEKMAFDPLVVFAESCEFNSPRVRDYLHEKLAAVSADTFETVVLGCTHFVFFRHLIANILGPEIRIIDGNQGTAQHLANILKKKISATGKGPRLTFYSSGVKDSEERVRQLSALLSQIPDS